MSTAVSERGVRACLDAVLAAPEFASAERLSKFLRFAVEQSLAGTRENCKEYVIGLEVFDRGPEFDPKADPIVRISAGKVRSKLREYYERTPDAPLRIEMPKGGYAAVFTPRDIAAEPNPALSRRRILGWTAAAVLVGGGLLAWRRLPDREPVESRLKQITVGRALARMPVLSRDGKLAAYISDAGGSQEVWLRQIDTRNEVELTHEPGDKLWPDIAPDGSAVAYGVLGDRPGVWIVPAIGGEPRLLVEGASRSRYSPDGASILYWGRDRPPGIVPAGGGTLRPLQLEAKLDLRAAVWSPDGNHVLLETIEPAWHLVPVNGGSSVRSNAHTFLAGRLPESGRRGPQLSDWYGNFVYFSAETGSETANILRARIDPRTATLSGEPEQLTLGPGYSATPRVAAPERGPARMIFCTLTRSTDAYTVSLDSGTGTVAGKPRRETFDGALDFTPLIPADGSFIAYCSRRSSQWDIWRKDLASGRETSLLSRSEPVHAQVVSGDGSVVLATSWKDRKRTYLLVPSNGSAPRTVCEDCGLTDVSHDGKAVVGVASGAIFVRDVITGREIVVGRDAPASAIAHFSPEGGRLLLRMPAGRTGTFRISIVPIHSGSFDSPGTAIRVAEGPYVSARWSPGGESVLFNDISNNRMQVMRLKLEPSGGRSAGAPVPIFYIPGAHGVAPTPGFTVSKTRLAFPVSEATSSVWMRDLSR